MKTPWKSPSFYFGLTATFIAIGGAVDTQWGVFGIVPPSVVPYISWLCFGLLLVGIVLFLISLVGLFETFDYVNLLRIKLGEILLGAKNSSIQYNTYPANTKDVNSIFNLCLETIGVGISRPKKMKAWLKHNGKIFYKLVPISDEDKERSRNIQAYFCLIPLNSKAVEHLENHELDGASFTTGHICKPGGKVSAWYIGGVAGKNKYSRISAMRSLLSHIMSLSNGDEKYFYTRPVTKDGLKWVKRLRFEALEPDHPIEKDELCKLKITSGLLNDPTLSKVLQRTNR